MGGPAKGIRHRDGPGACSGRLRPERWPTSFLPLGMRCIRLWVFVSFLTGVPLTAAVNEKTKIEAPRPTARAATAVERQLLNDVLHKSAGDFHRWAYTEHRVMRDDKGRIKSDTLLRYDPSKPYAEQWNPLKINGREPSERDRAKYRRRGEKSASEGPMSGGDSDRRRRPALGELIDLSKSFIATETATHLVYEVPLLKNGNERFPPEKFLVLVRVRKEGVLLENVAVRLRESFRAKLVVKVKSGEGSLDFGAVNPKYPPTLVAIEGDAVASVLFINVGGSMELKRTELKHVKPFDERFDVQIGTLKAIDF